MQSEMHSVQKKEQRLIKRKITTRKTGQRLTKEENIAAKETFLKTYKTNGTIFHSCRAANVTRETFYKWLEHDEDFSILYHQAEKDFGDIVLGEAVTRAVSGYEKPVISMGKIVYQADGTPLMERVVSDPLLTILLKRHHPEYREKSQMDMTTNVNVTSNELIIDTRALTTDQLEKLKTLAIDMKAGQRS